MLQSQNRRLAEAITNSTRLLPGNAEEALKLRDPNNPKSEGAVFADTYTLADLAGRFGWTICQDEDLLSKLPGQLGAASARDGEISTVLQATIAGWERRIELRYLDPELRLTASNGGKKAPPELYPVLHMRDLYNKNKDTDVSRYMPNWCKKTDIALAVLGIYRGDEILFSLIPGKPHYDQTVKIPHGTSFPYRVGDKLSVRTWLSYGITMAKITGTMPVPLANFVNVIPSEPEPEPARPLVEETTRVLPLIAPSPPGKKRFTVRQQAIALIPVWVEREVFLTVEASSVTPISDAMDQAQRCESVPYTPVTEDDGSLKIFASRWNPCKPSFIKGGEPQIVMEDVVEHKDDPPHPPAVQEETAVLNAS